MTGVQTCALPISRKEGILHSKWLGADYGTDGPGGRGSGESYGEDID